MTCKTVKISSTSPVPELSNGISKMKMADTRGLTRSDKNAIMPGSRVSSDQKGGSSDSRPRAPMRSISRFSSDHSDSVPTDKSNSSDERPQDDGPAARNVGRFKSLGEPNARVKAGLSRGLARVHSPDHLSPLADKQRGVQRLPSQESIARPPRVPTSIQLERTDPDGRRHIDKVEGVPEVAFKGVDIGDMLGAGSFASVYKIKSIKGIPKRGHKLALKVLSDKTLANPETRDVAERDLASEANILATLPMHDNVVSLHAVSAGFWEKPASGFIIMERLTETLDARLKRWALNSENCYDRLKEGATSSVRQEQRDRIVLAGVGLARALEFLHANKLLYRDLKPKNLGYDVNGNLRIFDFGLSKFLEEDDNRLHTVCAGTPRYMAPEVFTGEYDLKADVYSFSILLWQICTLEKPFPSIKSIEELEDTVSQGYRPTLRAVASVRLAKMLRAAWDPIPGHRPSMDKIVKALEREASPPTKSRD